MTTVMSSSEIQEQINGIQGKQAETLTMLEAEIKKAGERGNKDYQANLKEQIETYKQATAPYIVTLQKQLSEAKAIEAAEEEKTARAEAAHAAQVDEEIRTGLQRAFLSAGGTLPEFEKVYPELKKKELERRAMAKYNEMQQGQAARLQAQNLAHHFNG